MPTAAEFDILSDIWDQSPKSPDEDHITYTEDDIKILWLMGFVDTEKYSMETWIGAFAPYRQPDNNYILNRTEFVALDKYRYKGEIYALFDAMLIHEGKYTDEGLQQLVENSIIPECGLPRVEVLKRMDTIKDEQRTPDGLIKIDRAVKQRIAGWLDDNPSPLRRLEMLFEAGLKSGEIDLSAVTLPGPNRAAQAEASTFSLLSSQPEISRKQALQKLEKTKIISPTLPDDPGTPLHKIRRSRRGLKS